MSATEREYTPTEDDDDKDLTPYIDSLERCRAEVKSMPSLSLQEAMFAITEEHAKLRT